jgi:hypothetical protein
MEDDKLCEVGIFLNFILDIFCLTNSNPNLV